MATKSTSQKTGIGLKLPEFLSIKDLITIISIAISMTLAWGVFTTRITVLEKEVVRLQDDNQKLSSTVDKLQDAATQNDLRQHEDMLLIDQLFIFLKRPAPNRSK